MSDRLTDEELRTLIAEPCDGCAEIAAPRMAEELLAARDAIVGAYIGGHLDGSIGHELAKYLGPHFESFVLPAEAAVACLAVASTDPAVRDGVERRLREIGIVR